MSQQLLKRAKIHSTGQQMRGEAVAKSVRRKAVRKTEPLTRRRDGPSHQVGIERATSRPDEQMCAASPWIRALPDVIIDCFAHGRHNRHDPRL